MEHSRSRPEGSLRLADQSTSSGCSSETARIGRDVLGGMSGQTASPPDPGAWPAGHEVPHPVSGRSCITTSHVATLPQNEFGCCKVALGDGDASEKLCGFEIGRVSFTTCSLENRVHTFVMKSHIVTDILNKRRAKSPYEKHLQHTPLTEISVSAEKCTLIRKRKACGLSSRASKGRGAVGAEPWAPAGQ